MKFKSTYVVAVSAISLLAFQVEADAQSSRVGEGVSRQVTALKNMLKSYSDSTNSRIDALESTVGHMETCAEQRQVYDAATQSCFSATGHGTHVVSVPVNTSGSLISGSGQTYSIANSRGSNILVSVGNGSRHNLSEHGYCTLQAGSNTLRLTQTATDVPGVYDPESHRDCDSSGTQHRARTRYNLYHGENGALYSVINSERGDIYHHVADNWDGRVTCYQARARWRDCSGDRRGPQYKGAFSAEAFRVEPVNF